MASHTSPIMDHGSLPYNPSNAFEARQPGEPVSHFLQRLPPVQAESTVPHHLPPPWFWISNPHRSVYDSDRADRDIDSFTREGFELLHEFKQNLGVVAKNSPLRTELREVLRLEIGNVAKKWNVTAGKWLLFPKVDEVNQVWRAVCEAVDANRLGTGAKVSTSGQRPGDSIRLICVYTKDFTDVEDVRRVLLALVEMGLVRADMPRGISYKCDAYTYLGIYANNEYGLPVSIYGSKEMLTGR